MIVHRRLLVQYLCFVFAMISWGFDYACAPIGVDLNLQYEVRLQNSFFLAVDFF